MSLRNLIAQVDAFKLEATTILGECETSSLRVVNVEASLRRLDQLTLDQDELMRQALFCAAQGYCRAAIISSWAAFMDALESILASDGLTRLHLMVTWLSKTSPRTPADWCHTLATHWAT